MGTVQRVPEASGIWGKSHFGRLRSHWKGLAYRTLYKGANDEN